MQKPNQAGSQNRRKAPREQFQKNPRIVKASSKPAPFDYVAQWSHRSETEELFITPSGDYVLKLSLYPDPIRLSLPQAFRWFHTREARSDEGHIGGLQFGSFSWDYEQAIELHAAIDRQLLTGPAAPQSNGPADLFTLAEWTYQNEREALQYDQKGGVYYLASDVLTPVKVELAQALAWWISRESRTHGNPDKDVIGDFVCEAQGYQLLFNHVATALQAAGKRGAK